MPFLAIPNISVGSPGPVLDGACAAVTAAGARLLDVHSDRVHNRSVLTVSGERPDLVAAMVALAQACRSIDLAHHRGVHPRVGALDVCPFVTHKTTLVEVVEIAHITGRAIAEETGIPVFFYGGAATRTENSDLPNLRWGGLEGLMTRVSEGLEPDEGPPRIDPSTGVVLVGARGPLIAFNVWLDTSPAAASSIASEVREPGLIRALGLSVGAATCQVSMNLISPDDLGIEEAFDRVRNTAGRAGAKITGTEIVGLVPERFLPGPDAEATRLLMQPGHSLESVLAG